MSKLNKSRASHYLAIRYPEIKDEIYKLSFHQNFAGVLQAIVNYLKDLISQEKIKTTSRLIRTVGWVYFRGDQYMKDIIEHLFVRSLEGIRKRCTAEQWNFLFKRFPIPFRRIYLIQYKNNLYVIR